jgi:GTP-binding protein
MADIGLLGLPNAGKSTFLRAVTASRAKVGAYPFTTLVPNLGVTQLGDQDVVIADIPGLVEGAHTGQGLGDRFLKHLERTRALIHLLSLSADSMDPLDAFDTINRELNAYSEHLAALPQVVVLNKADLVDEDEITMWTEGFEERGVAVMSCSALTTDGVRDVVVAASKHIDFESPEVSDSDAEEEGWSPI